MAEKKELIEQTNLAFDYLQKLFLEVSYLIKEAEAMYREENIVIGKPGGYAISVRKSSGLESASVDMWLYKKFAVFFVHQIVTETKGGQRTTDIGDDLKVIYMRIILRDRSVQEPTVYTGVLYDIKNKGKAKWITKFEHYMGHFEGRDEKVFDNPSKIEYDDAYISLKGELITVPLYEINTPDDIRDKIVDPSLDLLKKYERPA